MWGHQVGIDHVLMHENYDADVIKYSFPENYSIYGVEIELTRVLSPYLLSVYLPSAMFVSMSWVRETSYPYMYLS